MIIQVIIKTIYQNSDDAPETSLHCAFKTIEEAKQFMKDNCSHLDNDGLSGYTGNSLGEFHYSIEETYLK